MSDRYCSTVDATELRTRVLGIIESDEPAIVLFERAQVVIPSNGRRPTRHETIHADLPRLESELIAEFQRMKELLAAIRS